ncbi:Seven_transmembrane protein 1 [Hexamita inflata]|uniref:Seven transmembrane protein 1 n=1 Tax=Hexamita inflata TaxID=28002 RepID=A0AA86UJT6_9EUKA|nr:Seven transmembrane protein 1 [Hexamita inflata]
MICTCTQQNYNLFIAALFGACVYDKLNLVAFIISWVSIVIQFIAQYPQIRLNFIMKTTEGLTPVYVYSFLICDVVGIVSLFMLKAMITQFILQFVYLVQDSYLAIQIFYYRNSTKRVNAQTTVNKLEGTIYFIIVSLLIELCGIYGVQRSKHLKLFPNEFQLCYSRTQENKTLRITGTVLSYVSVPFIATAFLAQIIKNHKTKQMEELSFVMFSTFLLGGILQTVSIILDIVYYNNLAKQVGFLLVQVLPILANVCVLIQFYVFRKKSK